MLVWLSYADDKRSRGVILLEAQSFLEAASEARRLGISPGGQVSGFPVEGEHFPASMRNRLLSPKEIEDHADKIGE